MFVENKMVSNFPVFCERSYARSMLSIVAHFFCQSYARTRTFLVASGDREHAIYLLHI